MAVCGHLAPNGEKSILYDQLYVKYGETKAHDIWEQVRSQQFLNKYGDWFKLAGVTRAMALDKVEEAWRGNTNKNGFPKEALQPLLDAVNKKYDEAKVPLDANGEPTIEWVEQTLSMPPVLSSYKPPIVEPVPVEDKSTEAIASLIAEKQSAILAISKPVFVLNRIKDSVALKKVVSEEISHKGELTTRETTISKQQSAIVKEFKVLEQINDCLHG